MGDDLTKLIEGHRFVIKNTNFLFHSLLYLFIGIYYNRFELFNYFNKFFLITCIL
jgi:hypothetical protein